MSKLELLHLLDEKVRRQQQNALAYIFPDEGEYSRDKYQKHCEFMALGANTRVRAFLAANRIGKTTTGTVELAYHLTGQYPHWWKGKRFDRPIRAWCAGDTQTTTRDGLQRRLLGAVGNYGTGWIPKSAIAQVAAKAQPNGAVDFVTVRHVSGARSTLVFKSYDMGRAKFQADDIDVILLDEEPKDYGIYSECVTRTATTGGIVMLTFTALRGITPLVCRFMPEFARGTDLDLDSLDDGSSRAIVVCGWDDVPHLDEETKKQLKSEYAPHEIQARTLGIPSVGIGSIYPVPERDFVIDPIPLPDHWPRVCALDPGWNRTAALWGAWDQEADCVYLYSEHYRGYAEVEVHAAAIKARGIRIPVVSDNAYDVNGGTIIDQYRKQGLLIRKAQKSDKDGRIQQVYSRLSTGRMKVFATLHNWLFEFRMYRRDEHGRIASEHDHLMNCFHPDTLVQTDRGIQRIASMARAGWVVTTGGELAEYDWCGQTGTDSEMVRLSFSDGSSAVCTPDHRFLTPAGWVEAKDMENYECEIAIGKLSPTRSRNIGAFGTTGAEGTFSGTVGAFIAWFGRKRTALSRAASTCITSIMTAATTRLRTLLCFVGPSTPPITNAGTAVVQCGPWMPPRNGMARAKGGIGTASTTPSSPTGCTSKPSSTARIAGSDTQEKPPEQTSSAHRRAALPVIGQMAGTPKRDSARTVATSSPLPTDTQRSAPARHAAVLRCLGVSAAPRSPTYCLRVPTTHAFALANGAIVHNCSEYLCQSGLPVARMVNAPRETHTIPEQTFGIYQ